MSYITSQVNEEESLSQSSDEKMDTGSESIRSQDTPNSTLSSDFEEKADVNVLRLQNPENEVLRLSEPDATKETTDNYVQSIEDLESNGPNFVLNPHKNKNNLVLTTSHPLMILSPNDYPDLIPKKLQNEQDLSSSSLEEDKNNENGFPMYSPDTNNSKNNLYFSDNFTTAESNIICDKDSPPDVAKVTPQRRKIKPRFIETPPHQETPPIFDNTPHTVLGRIVDGNKGEVAITKYVEELNKKLDPRMSHSTPNTSVNDSRVAQWCEFTQSRIGPSFDLPIELSNHIAVQDLDSPDVLSSSTQDERSAFEALLDPVTGCAALRPTTQNPQCSPNTQRRRIMLPPEEDSCSLDSVCVSMGSEEEPPELLEGGVEDQVVENVSDEDTKRTKSPKTCSECSDTIPEYSAAEEFYNERSFVTVKTGEVTATLDMKVIEPFKRVISHGGYDAQGSAIIVFSACYLPDTHRADYKYTMDQLFLYVIWSLERLIGEEYVLIYLHGSGGSRRLPSFRWLHECYTLIDRRLRKSLKHLYLVHPTFWLKTFVVLTKPFVSSKFFRKLSYVPDLATLYRLVPVQPHAVPDLVKQYDQRRQINK